MKAFIAIAVIAPTPGIVARRRISSSCFAMDTISRSSFSIRAAKDRSDRQSPQERSGQRAASVRHFISDDCCQRLHVSDPDCSDDAQLAHMSAQGIDRLGPLAHEQSTSTENHDRCLLLSRFDRHEAHGFARHSFADCLSIGRIGLSAFDEWLHILRGYQANVVTKSLYLTSPMMRATASFHSDAAWRKFCEESQNLSAAQLSIE
ncbi:hypothetical protein FB009_12316 [Sinorhizobium medicae]|nr:hypothetical protein FB009_12316 [Sinorhizobium medicae]